MITEYVVFSKSRSKKRSAFIKFFPLSLKKNWEAVGVPQALQISHVSVVDFPTLLPILLMVQETPPKDSQWLHQYVTIVVCRE